MDLVNICPGFRTGYSANRNKWMAPTCRFYLPIHPSITRSLPLSPRRTFWSRKERTSRVVRTHLNANIHLIIDRHVFADTNLIYNALRVMLRRVCGISYGCDVESLVEGCYKGSMPREFVQHVYYQ